MNIKLTVMTTSKKTNAMRRDKVKKLLYGIVMCGAMISQAGPAIAAVVTRVVDKQYEPSTGLLAKEMEAATTSALCLVKAYGYDAYGNQNASTTRNCNGSTGEAAAPGAPAAFAARTTAATYDASGRFPQTLTNALSQNETRVYDARFNQPSSQTDINGLTSTWQYDSLGRKTLEIRPDGNRTRWTYSYCSGVNGGTAACPANAKYLVQTTPLASDGLTQNGPWTKAYYNAIDREVRTETQGFDGTTLVSQETEYNGRKEVYRTARPYFAGDTKKWTVFTYDALSRVVREDYPDTSVVEREYKGVKTTVTHPLTRTKTTEVNSQGQTIKITDAYGKNILYSYDPFGNLLRTTDSAGNLVRVTYNVRGHRVSIIDPDLGTWIYTNDALGQVANQRDAKLQTTSFIYDKLGRMTKRTAPDLVSNWTYDSCTKGVGQLCQSSTSTGFNQALTYDTLGRLSQTDTVIDTLYSQSVTYDPNGRIDTMTYPTGLVTKNVYNVRGYLHEVRNGDASNALYWQANSIDAEGHVLLQTFGNGVTSQQAFNPNNGRLTTVYTGAGNSVQNFTYGYDLLGNITNRTDGNQSLTETFGYDLLNRLTSATVNSGGAGIVTDTYGYNDLGNVTSRSDLGTYTYPASGASSVRPHAVTVIDLPDGSKRQYGYDTNGNMTTEIVRDAASNVVLSAGRKFTYTSFNLPSSITAPYGGGTNAKTSTFAYGPDLQRVRQISNVDGTTIYLNPDNNGALYYEKDVKPTSDVEHRHFITAYGSVVALVKQTSAGSAVSYLHRDNLGSTTTVTDTLGNAVERLAYEPFGKRRFPDGVDDTGNTIDAQTTDRGFTNHEHMDELGLIHMNGRIYDPLLMRFTTADPTMPNALDMQNYNRYAYVRNNPLRLLDPSGFTPLPKDSDLSSATGGRTSTGQVTHSNEGGTSLNAQQRSSIANTTANGTVGAVRAKPVGKVGGIRGAIMTQYPTLMRQQANMAKAGGSPKAVYDAERTASLAEGRTLPEANKIAAEAAAQRQAAIQAEAQLGAKQPTLGVSEGAHAQKSADIRAKELHSVLDERAQRARTTSVIDTKEGVRVVSSSEARLTPAQRAALAPNEVEGVGIGHAEVTGVNAAKQMGLNPTGAAASRPICSSCANTLQEQGVTPLSPLKR